MTEDEARDAIDAYGRFLALALARAKEWGCYICRDNTIKSAYISDKGEVVIEGWLAEMNYDCPTIEPDTCTFPLAFFLADDAGRAQMLIDKKAKAKAESDAWYAKREAEERAAEIAAYARLKAKYGPATN